MKKKPDVPHFIEEERQKGRSDEEIRRKLLNAGWQIDIIHNAMQNKRRSVTLQTPVNKALSYKEMADNAIRTPFFLGGILVLLVLLAVFI